MLYVAVKPSVWARRSFSTITVLASGKESCACVARLMYVRGATAYSPKSWLRSSEWYASDEHHPGRGRSRCWRLILDLGDGGVTALINLCAGRLPFVNLSVISQF